MDHGSHPPQRSHHTRRSPLWDRLRIAVVAGLGTLGIGTLVASVVLFARTCSDLSELGMALGRAAEDVARCWNDEVALRERVEATEHGAVMPALELSEAALPDATGVPSALEGNIVATRGRIESIFEVGPIMLLTLEGGIDCLWIPLLDGSDVTGLGVGESVTIRGIVEVPSPKIELRGCIVSR